MQASLPQLGHLVAGDLRHTGVRQRGEQERCPGRSVAPGVGHRLDVPGRRRDGARDDEPVLGQRTDVQQVLGALRGRVDEVRAVQGRPGDGQRGGHPGGAVGVVRHPERHPGPRPPVEAGVGPVGGSQQCLASGGGDRPGVLAAGPDGPQHDAGGSRDDVGERRVGPVLLVHGRRPPFRGHPVDEPVQRRRLLAGREQPQRHRVAGQPVVQGGLDAEAHPGREPSHHPGREGLLDVGQRAGAGDLGQDRREPGDPGVQRVAVPGGCRLRVVLRHGRREPRAVVAAHLVQHPGPGCFTQLPVRAAHQHGTSLALDGLTM